jgi:hypothetical protein
MRLNATMAKQKLGLTQLLFLPIGLPIVMLAMKETLSTVSNSQFHRIYKD